MCFVGPRQTEYASTHGMIAATRTTHETVSKNERNQKPRTIVAASRAKFANRPAPATSSTTASTTSATPTGKSPRQSRSGSASSTSANTAGISTHAIHATSHHRPASHQRSCVS